MKKNNYLVRYWTDLYHPAFMHDINCTSAIEALELAGYHDEFFEICRVEVWHNNCRIFLSAH